jgi:spermidine synthase
MLYTTEFFELVKRHLNPGGVVTLFVQLYESNTEAVKSEIGTFFNVFPHGMVFGNTYNGMGYDLVLLGQVEPTRIDLDEMERRLKRPGIRPLAKSLAAIGMSSASDLFATFAGQGPEFRGLAGRRRDQSRSATLRLQYLAGRGLNLYRADRIYAEMLRHSKEPDGIFTGSAELEKALLQKIRSRGGG